MNKIVFLVLPQNVFTPSSNSKILVDHGCCFPYTSNAFVPALLFSAALLQLRFCQPNGMWKFAFVYFYPLLAGKSLRLFTKYFQFESASVLPVLLTQCIFTLNLQPRKEIAGKRLTQRHKSGIARLTIIAYVAIATSSALLGDPAVSCVNARNQTKQQ